MKYNAPFDAVDPDDGYTNGNPGSGTEGSIIPAEAIEYTQREIVAAIAAAGLTPANTDLAQLVAAIYALSISKSRIKAHGCIVGTTLTGAFNAASVTHPSSGVLAVVFTVAVADDYQIFYGIEDPTLTGQCKYTSKTSAGFTMNTALTNGVAQDFAKTHFCVVAAP